jgi:hypothetical protein
MHHAPGPKVSSSSSKFESAKELTLCDDTTIEGDPLEDQNNRIVTMRSELEGIKLKYQTYQLYSVSEIWYRTDLSEALN